MKSTPVVKQTKSPAPLLLGDIDQECFEEADRALFISELEAFVPESIFDSHAHCYRLKDINPEAPPEHYPETTEYTIAKAFDRMAAWMGKRATRQGLFFPYPCRGVNRMGANTFLIDQLRQHTDCRGLLLATPQDSVAAMAPLLDAPGVSGFKTYHVFASEDTFNQPVGQWTPEWVWEVAHDRGWVIMLHIVLPHALSDPENQRYLVDHCMKYPRAKPVLAHAARGFNPRHTINGMEALRGLPNVYFDTSAVAEPTAFETILDVFGPGRLLYGSDFPVSEMCGRSLALGSGFYWLYQKDFVQSWLHGKPVPSGLESLLALKNACGNMSLNRRDIERIFHINAKEMLGIPVSGFWADVQEQYREATRLIPGGTQLFSKRPELFAPGQWPAYYEEARGCEIIDTSGRHYIDMAGGGILACALGYADPDVNKAVLRRVRMGGMSTLQTFDEVELARELIAIHPWSQQVRYTRGGGEAMAVAVRIARVATGKSKVAVCGYHGWHDWYMAANLGNEQALDGHLLPGLEPGGVPRELAGTTLTFAYNNSSELDSVLQKAGDQLAAIVMEPTRSIDPEPGFLEYVRKRADEVGACLIFDEISIGWRLCLGGAHLLYGVNPDIAVFAKTISNGFAMGAILGRRKVMEAAQNSFISSAYWTEGVGPAAALATVRKLKSLDVPAHLNKIGSMLGEGWMMKGKRHGLPTKTGGRPELLKLGFNHDDEPALMTYVTAAMLHRGFLAGASFNPMWSHKESHVSLYLEALDDVFGLLSKSMARGTVAHDIGGPVKHGGFKRLAD